MSSDIRLDALQYHSQPRPGKVETLPCKPCFSQRDLTLAYSPGVAEPCLRIQEDPSQSALYTGRSNLVGVITNGTAVLGLGNIGPDAAKPVMEGKGVLFKVFADIDVFDIELNVKEPEKLIETIKTMEPTFGAINLEDIKAPECFMVEERLRQEMNIPVFHDDQHGTAVISGAALLNAAELTGRKLEDMKVVVVGAGAAGISCAKFYMTLGVRREHIYMFDSKGLIHTGRIDLHATKAQFSQSEDCSLEEALTGADVFLGLSTKGLLTQVRASVINEQMKIAAARALADLAKEPVPQEVIDLYGGAPLSFGIDYVIPKPIDPRIIEWECPAVTQAAMISGVAQSPIRDMEAYTLELRKRIAAARERVSGVVRSYL